MKYATTILLAVLLVMMIPSGALKAEDGEREGDRKVERRREGERRREVDGERKREGEGDRRREGEGQNNQEGEGGRRREGEGQNNQEGEGGRRREGEGERKREGEGRSVAGEGDRRAATDRRDEMGQLRKILAEIAVRLAKMEGELSELRRVNADLRRELGRPARAAGEGKRRREGEGERKREGDGERRREGEGEGEGDRAAGGLPQGIRGFRGMLEGTIVKKGQRSFVLKVTKTGKTWTQNQAKNPRDAIGKEIEILIQAERGVTDRWKNLVKEHLQVLGTLKAGDRVTVEAFHFGGGHLVVMEELRKIT